MNKVISGIIISLALLVSACHTKTDNKDEAAFKPRFHFSAATAWTGEPTGLVYNDGTYHLFYQYNPSSDMFGNIHWGHAVSTDLLQWQILPVSFAPDSRGYLNSGSVVADTGNTSGFAPDGKSPFIAFYTCNNPDWAQTVSMAYSLDEGLSWTQCDEIRLSDDKELTFRNPHVSRSDLYNEWIMTVSVGASVRFYSSSDCRKWTYKSEFKAPGIRGGNWEGSDLFPLKTEGSDATKWVLLVNMESGSADGSPATRYFVGDFDGTTFQPTQTKELWLDYGKDQYAASTFNGLPEGERIGLGWMNCWEYANLLPTSGWRGNMTFPRKLSLVQEGKHYLLTSLPVENLKQCEKDMYSIPPAKLSEENMIAGDFPYPDESFAIRLTFDTKDNLAIWRARDYGIRLKTKSGKTLSIGYQNELSYYYINRNGLEKEPFAEGFGRLMGATYRPGAATSDWYILFDRNSIELFADGGRIAMTALCYPDEAFDTFQLFAEAGNIALLEGSITMLSSSGQGKKIVSSARN